MEEKTLREQQMEALEELDNYLNRLLPAVKSIINELRGEKRADTDELFQAITNGINWTIEVLNRTMEIINESGDAIDKENINIAINKLSISIKEHDDLDKAMVLEKYILPFLSTLKSRIQIVTNIAI
ncbi:molecular chaperone [Anaerocolumna sp. MB42-C2]|uniref:molecular chaperone n=1 Tax=Anaerocolumna sp. MB42-C2 TaxID=3070997 RepID=UPI0027E11411|nr:molecular chaperone [Anaerocolumna sp. MB42-C2]WMJ90210.1 molecular chaperone [Anaerocolumna sp. MB42-C2]